MGVQKLQVKNALIAKARTYGNSHYTDKHLCSDLVNQWGTSPEKLERLSEITFLSVATLKRMSTLKEPESGGEYWPSSETITRILAL